MNSYVKQSHRMGIFFVIWFMVCFAWFYTLSTNQQMYFWLLRLNFFDFTGMNIASFISGFVQSYLWGYIAVASWVLASKFAGFKKY